MSVLLSTPADRYTTSIETASAAITLLGTKGLLNTHLRVLVALGHLQQCNGFNVQTTHNVTQSVDILLYFLCQKRFFSLRSIDKRVAQLSQKNRAAGWVGMARNGRLTGRQYFTDIIGLSSTTVT